MGVFNPELYQQAVNQNVGPAMRDKARSVPSGGAPTNNGGKKIRRRVRKAGERMQPNNRPPAGTKPSFPDDKRPSNGNVSAPTSFNLNW